MENLAGNPNCDATITKELNRCLINLVSVPKSTTEVPFSIEGKLGDFTFTRAWIYWIASGKIPKLIAEELYRDPVGREDVCAGGFAGGHPIDGFVLDRISDDGKKVRSLDLKAGLEAIHNNASLSSKWLGDYVFVENPEEIGELCVTFYHIDTEIGLRLFSDTLRKHGLVPETA